MIKLDLVRIMKLRNVKYPQPYLTRHGFTEHQARTLLSDELKMLRLSHLTKLCELFNSLPNDLFTWKGAVESHLAALQREVPDLSQLLANKSPQEIEEILRKLANGEI